MSDLLPKTEIKRAMRLKEKGHQQLFVYRDLSQLIPPFLRDLDLQTVYRRQDHGARRKSNSRIQNGVEHLRSDGEVG